MFPFHRFITTILVVFIEYCYSILSVHALCFKQVKSNIRVYDLFSRVTDTPSLGPHYPCPENWVWFRCNCYYFSKEMLSWRESQRACLSLNSTLIRISKEEMVSCCKCESQGMRSPKGLTGLN